MTTLERPRVLYPAARERPAVAAPRRTSRPSINAILLSGAGFLAVWQAAVMLGKIPSWLLPSPLAVAQRMRVAIADGTLRSHVVPTLIESSGGFMLALVAGVLLGYLIAHSPRLERWIAPYLSALQSVPVIAIAPLLVVWTPNGLLRNIIIAALVVFFPIFAATVAGLRGIPRELREVAVVEGAHRWQTIRMVEAPLALPTLFSGIRTSLAYATTGAVVAEFVGTRYGLGAMINIARGLLDMPLLFVAIISLIAITLVFYTLLILVERRLTAWNDS